MRHGLTKEMKAKKRTMFRSFVMSIAVFIITYGVALWISALIDPRLRESKWKVDFGERLAIALFACVLSASAALLVWWLCRTMYALIRGMYIGINDNYAIGFVPVHYQFSRIHEEQSYYDRKRITRLYLTMDSDELEVLFQEQWTSVWFSGRAILPVELAIPGRSFSTLYICRSTFKRIRKEVQQSHRSIFVQLIFEFTETERIGRTSYERDRTLMSMWDATELRRIHQDQPDIRFSDDSHQRYLIAWEQLEQYECTLTEAYQIIDPQPIIRSDNTV